MSEMPKTYDAASVEERMLQKWLDGKYYARSKGKGDRTVVIPPPNVTGMLHMAMRSTTRSRTRTSAIAA